MKKEVMNHSVGNKKKTAMKMKTYHQLKKQIYHTHIL